MGHLGSLQVLFGSPVGCYCTTGYSLVGQSYQEKWRLLVASPTDRLRRRKVGFSQTWLMLERAIRSPCATCCRYWTGSRYCWRSFLFGVHADALQCPWYVYTFSIKSHVSKKNIFPCHRSDSDLLLPISQQQQRKAQFHFMISSNLIGPFSFLIPRTLLPFVRPNLVQSLGRPRVSKT